MATRSPLRAIPVPLALLLGGALVNILVGQLVRNVLRWPIYLDSLGTIVAGALGGPIAGAATGAVSNLVWGVVFDDPHIIPYAITAACIGAAAALAAELDAFRHPLTAAFAGFLTGILAALVSAPISAYLLQGDMGGGPGALNAFFNATSANLLQAATLQGLLADPLDKAVSFVVAFACLRLLPAPVRSRFAAMRSVARQRAVNSRYGLAVALSVVAFAFSLVFLPAFGRNVYVVFYLTVAVSAWKGGLRPAILAILVGIAAMIILALPPRGPGLRAEDILNVWMFILVTTPIALIVDRLERTNEALQHALAERRRSEAEVRSIVEGVVEALMLVAPSQRVIRVNHQFEDLFGLSASSLPGTTLDELRPVLARSFRDPDDVTRLIAASAADQSEHFRALLEQVWPQQRQLDLVSAPVQSDGSFLGRLYGFRDVTQERELDRMKTEFVSQVSHELRTPLTAIKGFTEVLLDGEAGPVNSEQTEFLGIVKSNVDRLVALIDDLLDIARIEGGRIELKLRPVDLRAAIDEVVTTMRPLVDGKHQVLTVDVPANLPPARADHDRLVQVLTNLLSNAYKYTPAGGTLRITAEPCEASLRVAVHDSGIGISAEDQQRLFTRFYRVDSSLSREAGGTGLGLAIVKSIVELHGGAVEVASTPGVGSTFAFTLCPA